MRALRQRQPLYQQVRIYVLSLILNNCNITPLEKLWYH